MLLLNCQPSEISSGGFFKKSFLKDYLRLSWLGVIQKKKPFIRFAHLQGFVFLSLLKANFHRSEKQNPSPPCGREGFFLLSGWQDSNLRPSGPKPDALTGLRYTPLCPPKPWRRWTKKVSKNKSTFYKIII